MKQPVSRIALLVALGGIVPGIAAAQEVIDNGTVQLGINPRGNLVTGGIGLTFLPTSGETLAPGCACEGWGIADLASGAFGMAGQTFGFENIGPGTIIASGTGTDAASGGDSAISTVTVTDGAFVVDVEHDFSPSASDNLYQVDVTLLNAGAAEIGQLVYRRAMDWDVPPTEFSEFVTLQGWPAARLIGSSDDGFVSGNPNVPLSTLAGDAVLNGNFTDSGPADHGAAFDFSFGTVAAGDEADFTIFYGAAASEDDALMALSDVGAEVYSLGQPSSADGATLGVPNTFIFGFAGVGGTPIGGPVGHAISPLGDLVLMGTNHHLDMATTRFDALSFSSLSAASVSTQGDALMALGGLKFSLTGLGASGEFDSTTNNTGLDYTARYFGLNAEYSMGRAAGFERSLIGASFGKESFDADRKDDLGSLDGTIKFASVYAAGYNPSGLFGDVHLFHGNIEIDQTRIGVMNTFSSNPDANQRGARIRLGYNFGPEVIKMPGSLGFYGEITRSNTSFDSFSEDNNGVTTDAFDIDSNIVGIGTRYAYEAAKSNGMLYGYFDLSAMKDTMAKDFSVTQTTAGGASFQTAVDGRDDMFGKASAMVGFDFNNGLQGRLEGQRIFGNGRSENSVSFMIGMVF